MKLFHKINISMTNGRKKKLICGYDRFFFEHSLVTETLFTIHSLKIYYFTFSLLSSGSAGGGGGSGIPVYPKQIRQNTLNSSKYTQNYTQVYFIHEIQRKWYTEYPYLSCNIPYTRFKKPLYTVYPKTLADPVSLSSFKC